MAKITNFQIAKIHATAKELGYDRETLYNVVWNITRTDSISKLTVSQGVDVISGLVQALSPDSAKKPCVRKGMATEKQLDYINGLAKKLGWDDDPARLKAFIKKYAKVDSATFLTTLQASKVIEGLKSMSNRPKAE